jgi:hypothetical protein
MNKEYVLAPNTHLYLALLSAPPSSFQDFPSEKNIFSTVLVLKIDQIFVVLNQCRNM